ncbi:MAG: hypothetical protein Q7T79_02750 [bacterium]|nr:hypothetical protein [bacterium]
MENSFPVNKKKDTAEDIDQQIKKFQDSDGLSINKLNFGLWYVEHIKQMRLILIFILIIISAISWIYTIYSFTYYFVRGIKEDEIMIQQLIETKGLDHSYLVQMAAKDLVIYPAQALLSTNKKYDLLVQIKNINLKFWGKFDYYFLVNGKKTKQQSGFIFPGESKYLFVLAQDFSYQPTDVQLVVENSKWSRIDRQITNWQDYYDTHLNIINTDVKFIPAGQNELSQKLELNQLSYNSYNKTPYNYWFIDYLILFFSNNTVININKYTLTDFMSGQTRLIQLSWPGNIGRVDEVKIIPDINILDKNIYIKYKGKGAETL